MKRINTKRFFLGWLPAVLAFILLYSVGNTQYRKAVKAGNEELVKKDIPADDGDSVEVIGTPVNDDPWKEVENLVKAYYSKTGIAYKGTVKVIDDNGDKEKVLEEQPFEYTIVGNNYHYRLANMEVVNKKDLLLAIDHTGKTIAVSRKPALYEKRQNKLFDIKEFKKIMLEQNAHARVTVLGNEKILTIDNIQDPTIQGYRIYYSPQTYRVHKMLIGMLRLSPLDEETSNNEQDTGADDYTINEYYYYLEVVFTETEMLNVNEKEFNPENKFIRIDKKNMELMPGFTEYQLQNAAE